MIAAGGTGGHIFPGLALAEEIKERDREHHIIFIGTKSGMETSIIHQHGYVLKTVWGKKLKQGSWQDRFLAILLLPVSFAQSLYLLMRERPDCIIGIGGYAAGPFILMASCLRFLTTIIEPNSIPGMTNRILGRFVRRIYVAFSRTINFFPEKKTLHTGNPVRSSLIQEYQDNRNNKPEGFNLLILGGSQGAHQINKTMLEALPYLERERTRISIYHQTGVAECTWIQKRYQERGWEAYVTPFINHLGQAYAQSDLVISRAGASTISEIIACCKPTLFIPYPYAADDHQRYNAESLVHEGAGRMIVGEEVTGQNLAHIILDFLNHPEKLTQISQRLEELSGRNARQEIINDCFNLLRAA